jgi:hypothetical protein
VIVLAVSGALTATRIAGPTVLHALWRDPAKLADGQLWRLIIPALIQSNRSVVIVAEIFVLPAAVGAVAEQRLCRRRWLPFYLLGALVGHGIGEDDQPRQSGISLAFAGLLGALVRMSSTVIGRRHSDLRGACFGCTRPSRSR